MDIYEKETIDIQLYNVYFKHQQDLFELLVSLKLITLTIVNIIKMFTNTIEKKIILNTSDNNLLVA